MPVYCETGHPWHGIAEPVNFFTNGLIILAAIFALWLVLRRRPSHPAGLWLLIVLLFATGIGSALWHGLRTYWALRLDSLSGIFFLIAFTGLWAGALWGRLTGWLTLIGFVLLSMALLRLSIWMMGGVPKDMRPVMFLPFFAEVALLGAALVRASYFRGGKITAALGAATLGCGILAAVARSLDFYACHIIPFGSHFLWHGFLALAAYLGIRTLMALRRAQEDGRLHAA